MNDGWMLVTGATDGIGRATAAELVRRGHRVVVHGRDPAKVAAIAAEFGPSAQGEVADLADLSAVRALAQRWLGTGRPLSVLVANAGLWSDRRRLSRDGFELCFAVNHLAHFALTHELLPALRASTAARVVVVSSIAHQRGKIDLDDLQLERRWGPYESYASSKLANVLFANELARRLGGTAITVNSLHPGVITTKLLAQGFSTTGASVEHGALTSLRVALDPKLAGVTGRYFSDEVERNPAPVARDEQLAARFYEASARLAGVDPLPDPRKRSSA